MTDIDTQYRIIDSSAGWHERTDRGRIRVEGADRIAFLQALLTNDLAALGPGQGVYSAYLTPQGRMIADLRLYDRANSVLADVPAPGTAALVAKLDALIFAEDVRVSDASIAVSAITVVGARAAALVASATGTVEKALADLPPLGAIDAPPFLLARADTSTRPAFDVFVDVESRSSAFELLNGVGIEPIGRDVVELLRIEAGRPAFGQDMDEHTIPLEAGLLDRAISLTKGCYVGQEVIVRVLHRGGGRVARRLVTLSFDPALEAPPAPGTMLQVDGRDAGRITSAAHSPRLGRVVALGYVSREDAEAGREASAVVDGRAWRAEVTGLAG